MRQHGKKKNIAILVILGILAAIETLGYIDLQDDTYLKLAKGGAAAIQSTISMAFAQHLLGSDDAPVGPSAVCDDNVITDTPAGIFIRQHVMGRMGVPNNTITSTYGGQSAKGNKPKPVGP